MWSRMRASSIPVKHGATNRNSPSPSLGVTAAALPTVMVVSLVAAAEHIVAARAAPPRSFRAKRAWVRLDRQREVVHVFTHRSVRSLVLAGVLAMAAAVPAQNAPARSRSLKPEQARVWITTADGQDKLTYMGQVLERNRPAA